jgi:hypothetical protein
MMRWSLAAPERDGDGALGVEPGENGARQHGTPRPHNPGRNRITGDAAISASMYRDLHPSANL